MLMIVVALIGLTLWIVPMRLKCQCRGSERLLDPATIPWSRALAIELARSSAVSRPFQASGEGRSPRDRFVIMARPELDAGMVIRARPDIDAGMVIHPGTGGRSLWVAPLVGGGPVSPGQVRCPSRTREGRRLVVAVSARDSPT